MLAAMILLTVQEARILQAARIAKEAQKQLHQAGIEARKQERLWKNRIAAFRKAG